MKTLVAVLLCALTCNASCAEKTSAEAEHDREKRWDLPNIDVSWPALILYADYCKRYVFIHELKTLSFRPPCKDTLTALLSIMPKIDC